jgi:hypothetical protein
MAATTQMEMKMNVEVDVRRLSLQPGDKVWIETPNRLIPEQIGLIKQVVAEWSGLPAAAVLVLHDKLTLRILSKEETADVSASNP